MTLLFALIVHSIILGMSIGIAEAFPAFFELTLAVLSHKLFAGFALGTTMKAANIERAGTDMDAKNYVERRFANKRNRALL